MNSTDRREFLKVAAASLAATGLGSKILAEQADSPNGIPTRPLGKTGQRVSIVGLGGYHIGTAEENEAISIMHEAIDAGMTFFDNSWDYHKGGSETVMGKALAAPGKRDKVFLMTKVCARDYQGAREQLEDSLQRLQTDVIDLWQFHECNWAVDADWIYEQGGLKYALEAQKAGKIRYIGFTGHKDGAHHLRMLAKPHQWDTVQMPINILDAHFRSFQKTVLPVCTERKIGAIGMKAIANGILPRELGVPAAICRRYALTLPISTLVCGIASRKDLQQDLEMARNFKPVTGQELEDLIDETAEVGGDGKREPWKTARYGSAYHFQQHGE